MSNVREGLFQLAAHERYGDGIPARIRGIHAYASYHSGWIDTKFLYERPRVLIELDTKFGDIHADFEVDDITSGNCYELLTALTDAEGGAFHVRDLLDASVVLLPDENFACATIVPEGEGARSYDRERKAILNEPERSPVGRADDDLGIGTEARSLDWLTRQLRADYERHVGAHNGWLERTIDAVTTEDDTVRVLVEVCDGWRARWEFDDSFKGHLALREFAQGLDLPADVDELEGSLVYLQPVRDLHHTLPRTEFPLDALERWVIASDPVEPRPVKKSWFARLLDALSPSESGIEVSVGGRSRHAKSADEFGLRDECRTPACVLDVDEARS